MHKTEKLFLLGIAEMAIISFITVSSGFFYQANASIINIQNTVPIWPIANKNVSNIHDTFGPRLKNGTFSFHHGFDIKVPIGTPVVSILDGTVSKISTKGCPKHCQYRVEVKHAGSNNQYFYSSYQHLNSVNVVAGVNIKQGAIVGTSGWDSSYNYQHLHFEIRTPSNYEKNSIHPLDILPYQSTVLPTVSIVDVNRGSGSLQAQTVVPAYQQDIVGVEVFIYDTLGDQDPANDVPVQQKANAAKYDFASYSLDPSKYTTIKVNPADFNSSSTEQKITYTFSNVVFAPNGHTTKAVFRAYNAKGQFADTVWYQADL